MFKSSLSPYQKHLMDKHLTWMVTTLFAEQGVTHQQVLSASKKRCAGLTFPVYFSVLLTLQMFNLCKFGFDDSEIEAFYQERLVSRFTVFQKRLCRLILDTWFNEKAVLYALPTCIQDFSEQKISESVFIKKLVKHE